MIASHCNAHLYVQAKAGGAAVLADLQDAAVSPDGVALVGALLAPRQKDRMSVERALEHCWISGAGANAGTMTSSPSKLQAAAEG